MDIWQVLETILVVVLLVFVATGAVRSAQQGPGTFSLAITGGTGRFREARGELLVTATSGNSVPITVELAG